MLQNHGRDAIAGRLWSVKPYRFFYVSELPGEGGVDWGYTEDFRKAILISPDYQRRFACDMRRVGCEAKFFDR